MPGNELTSKLEEQVRAAVVTAGHSVPATKQAVVCRHPHDPARTLNLTPDILLTDHNIAIEVDPLGESDHSRAWTHTGEEDKDVLRNQLLAEAGWTVIRLRLGGKRGDHLGPRDVIAESTGFTRDVKEALLATLDDTINERRVKVRVVKKRKTNAPAQRRTPVVNIGPNDYTDDGHIFNWYPDLTGPRLTMRLAVNGRFLYTHSELRFIIEIGLHEVPEDQWRDRLTEYLADKAPETLGTTRWPWGRSLLVAGDQSPDTLKLVERIEYKTQKRGIDTTVIEQTVNCDRLAEYTGDAFMTSGGTVIASLHPVAADLGYRILRVERRTGRSGAYQAVLLARPPAFDPASLPAPPP